MNFKISLIALLFVSLFTACSSDKKTETKVTETKAVTEAAKTVEKQEDCIFSAKKDEIMVRWTAFKTTERVGVSGTFNEISTQAKSHVKSIAELITGTNFKINTGTVNTNNPERDVKLVTFFFKKMVGSDITGMFKNASGNDKAGKGVINLTMNGMAKDVPFVYEVEKNTLTIDANIEISTWKGESALASINQACKDLHKGKDGVSKTWDEVELKILVPLLADCK